MTLRKGMEGMAPCRTRRDRTTGAAQDEVKEEGVKLVGDRMVQIVEEEVCEGLMDITPTNHPHQDRQIIWGDGQNCWCGGGLAQQKIILWGGGVNKY